MTSVNPISKLSSALPFWLSLVMIPLAAIGAVKGGWTVFLLPIYGWGMISILDAAMGLSSGKKSK